MKGQEPNIQVNLISGKMAGRARCLPLLGRAAAKADEGLNRKRLVWPG